MGIEKKEKNTYAPGEEFKKSNYLIAGMYKASLFEKKILAIGLSRVKKDESAGKIFATIKAGEIKKLLNNNSGSFYAKLDNAANSFTGKKIGMSNPITQEFDYIVFITRSTYKNGEFTIFFNPDFADYIYDIKLNYTKFQLPMILSFNNNYAYTLYELLRSKAYTPKNVPYSSERVYKISMLLSELKFNLGLADVEDESAKKVLNRSMTPDFDAAIDVVPKIMFDRWCDFKEYVLDVAVKEINEVTELTVSYEKIGKGRGGKVHRIDFYVEVEKQDQKIKEQDVLSQEEKDTVIEEIMYMCFKERIKIKEATVIAEAAGWSLDKIKSAYEVYKNTSDVENIVGFMIAAIKNDYKKEAKSNAFNYFTKQIYDFEDIERQLSLLDII